MARGGGGRRTTFLSTGMPGAICFSWVLEGDIFVIVCSVRESVRVCGLVGIESVRICVFVCVCMDLFVCLKNEASISRCGEGDFINHLSGRA